MVNSCKFHPLFWHVPAAATNQTSRCCLPTTPTATSRLLFCFGSCFLGFRGAGLSLGLVDGWNVQPFAPFVIVVCQPFSYPSAPLEDAMRKSKIFPCCAKQFEFHFKFEDNWRSVPMGGAPPVTLLVSLGLHSLEDCPAWLAKVECNLKKHQLQRKNAHPTAAISQTSVDASGFTWALDQEQRLYLRDLAKWASSARRTAASWSASNASSYSRSFAVLNKCTPVKWHRGSGNTETYPVDSLLIVVRGTALTCKD